MRSECIGDKAEQSTITIQLNIELLLANGNTVLIGSYTLVSTHKLIIMQ